MRIPPPLTLTAREAAVLRRRLDADPTTPAARRARIVLLCAEGWGPADVADRVGCSRQTVVTWRERYRDGGPAGLLDAPRPGRPTRVDAAEVIARTLAPPRGDRSARWSSRTLADELGISNVAVAKVWRAWGISPLAGGRVRLGTRPALARPVSGIVAVHADAGLRVLGIRLGAGDVEADPVAAVGPRGGIGGRLDHHTGAGPTDATGFLDRLAALDDPALEDPALPDPAGRRLAVLVDGAPALPRRLTGRSLVHAVPPELCWTQLVRVLCALAAGTAGGAASVRRLRRHLDGLPAGHPVSWLDAPPEG